MFGQARDRAFLVRPSTGSEGGRRSREVEEGARRSCEPKASSDDVRPTKTELRRCPTERVRVVEPSVGLGVGELRVADSVVMSSRLFLISSGSFPKLENDLTFLLELMGLDFLTTSLEMILDDEPTGILLTETGSRLDSTTGFSFLRKSLKKVEVG